jgi:hypothetical protein
MRLALVGPLLVLTACVHGSTLLQREPVEESLYRRALVYLDPANERASLDSAAVLLDRYLASNAKRSNVAEAVVLRRLVEDALELERVEVVLRLSLAAQQRRDDAEEKRDSVEKRDTKPVTGSRRGDTARVRPSAEAAREIQRLRDELREANAELERIRKRLATTPPKP